MGAAGVPGQREIIVCSVCADAASTSARITASLTFARGAAGSAGQGARSSSGAAARSSVRRIATKS